MKDLVPAAFHGSNTLVADGDAEMIALDSDLAHAIADLVLRLGKGKMIQRCRTEAVVTARAAALEPV